MASDNGLSRREELLAVATKLFAARGYHGTRMDDVADVIGLNKATVYHYYASKSLILFDIYQQAAERTLAAVHDDPTWTASEALYQYTVRLLKQTAANVEGAAGGMLGVVVLMGFFGLENAFLRWNNDVSFIVYMKPDASQDQVQAIAKDLDRSPQVDSVEYFDEKKSYDLFKRIFRQENPEMLGTLQPDDLKEVLIQNQREVVRRLEFFSDFWTRWSVSWRIFRAFQSCIRCSRYSAIEEKSEALLLSRPKTAFLTGSVSETFGDTKSIKGGQVLTSLAKRSSVQDRRVSNPTVLTRIRAMTIGGRSISSPFQRRPSSSRQISRGKGPDEFSSSGTICLISGPKTMMGQGCNGLSHDHASTLSANIELSMGKPFCARNRTASLLLPRGADTLVARVSDLM